MDEVFEQVMEVQTETSVLTSLFGAGKGSGAAMLFGVIGIVGVMVCVCFWFLLRKYKWSEADT